VETPRDFLAVLDLPAGGVHPLLTAQHRPAEQGVDTRPVRGVQHEVGVVLQRLHGVTDGHAHLAELQHAVVVLRVADRQGAVPGQAELPQTLQQPRRLRHAGRQHHEGRPIADQLALHTEAADLRQHRSVMDCVTRQEHPALPDRNVAVGKRDPQPRVDRLDDVPGSPPPGHAPHRSQPRSGRSAHHLRKGGPKLAEDPTRDKQHRPASRPNARQLVQQPGRRTLAMDQRAVVVQGNYPDGDIARAELSHRELGELDHDHEQAEKARQRQHLRTRRSSHRTFLSTVRKTTVSGAAPRW
jgi:hypothetical protein